MKNKLIEKKSLELAEEIMHSRVAGMVRKEANKYLKANKAKLEADITRAVEKEMAWAAKQFIERITKHLVVSDY